MLGKDIIEMNGRRVGWHPDIDQGKQVFMLNNFPILVDYIGAQHKVKHDLILLSQFDYTHLRHSWERENRDGGKPVANKQNVGKLRLS